MEIWKEWLNIRNTSDSERKPEYTNLHDSRSRPTSIISQNIHAHKYWTLLFSFRTIFLLRDVEPVFAQTS